MANSQRRKDYIDRNGNMFVPMNVEGGNWNEHFFNTTKLVTMAGIIASLFVTVGFLSYNNYNQAFRIIVMVIWFIIASLVVRFVIFEEKFYYHMYEEMKQFSITTPAIFWDIASIKDTDEGAIMTYSDGKIGVIVKVERDTITGKDKDFRETHYDAISDFYKEVVINKYCFVQMDIMEPAGNDPRLSNLSKLVNKSDNANIRKLMEMEVGHIKNITNKTLYESDYFLIYTRDITRMDRIISDVTKYIFKLLDGAYISYYFLSNKDIVNLVKEENGVNYFNATQASLQMFNRNTTMITSPFNVVGIQWKTGETQYLNQAEMQKLRSITSSAIRETISMDNVSLKERIYRQEQSKFRVSFDDLSEINERKPRQPVQRRKVSQGNKGQPGNMQQPIQGQSLNQTMNTSQGQNSNRDDEIVDY